MHAACLLFFLSKFNCFLLAMSDLFVLMSSLYISFYSASICKFLYISAVVFQKCISLLSLTLPFVELKIYAAWLIFCTM